MFDDYKKDVLRYCLEEKKANRLSENLLSPTRAKLRDESLQVLKTRYHKKDEEAIKAFFDPKNKFNNLEESIRKFELDDFNAILRFLGSERSMRREENINILAWLIDFEPRPYKFGHIYAQKNTDTVVNKVGPNWDNWVVFPPVKPHEGNTDSIEENELILVEELVVQKEGEDIGFQDVGSGDGGGYGSSEQLKENTATTIQKVQTPSEKVIEKLSRKRNFTRTPAKIKSASIAFILIVAASLGTYLSIPNETVGIVNPILTGKEQCMYWTGESYRPILCNQKIENTPIIALDPQQLSGLKKITQPDTLTRNSINKVGYAKLGHKEIEFYTTTGNHPTIYNKRILPMTAYILNKYIVNK